jgi:hypothetical protein
MTYTTRPHDLSSATVDGKSAEVLGNVAVEAGVKPNRGSRVCDWLSRKRAGGRIAADCPPRRFDRFSAVE